MYEQLSIFDFIGDNKFCFDDDINYIVDRLDQIVSDNDCRIGKKLFSIWDHVPKYGYRLSYIIRVPKDIPTHLYDDLEILISEAKDRQVELSPMFGACWTFDGRDYGDLYCFSTFMDKKRRRIK